MGVELLGGNGAALIGITNVNVPQAFLKVGHALCHAQNGHDFTGGGDVEPGLTHHAGGLASQAGNNGAKCPVVHVHAPLPHHRTGVDAQVALLVLDVVVYQGRQQVVGLFNGREIARKVQIDVFHGNHLAVSASGSTAFDAKHGAQRRFPQGYSHLFAQAGKAVSQANGNRCFALSGRRG